MGFFQSRIEKKARETTEAAVKRAESSTDPIERTLGPGGADQVREAMAGLERFGIHLDADSALGLTPTAVDPPAANGGPPPAAAPMGEAPSPAATAAMAPATPAPATASAGTPTPASAPSSAADPIGEIERLAALHTSGALTDEEFAAAKKSVIGE